MIWKEREGWGGGCLHGERELERAQSTFARLKLDLTQPAFSPPPQRRDGKEERKKDGKKKITKTKYIYKKENNRKKKKRKCCTVP